MVVNTPKTPHNEVDKVLLLKTVPLFSELSDSDIEWFLKRARFVEYSKNNFLFQRGDSADYLYVIIEGWVKVYQDNQEGEQIVQTILTRGDTFGEECVIKGRAYPCHAQVAGRSARCLLISGQTLRERFEDQPAVTLKIISALADQLSKTGYFLELHSKLSAAQRLAAFLLKLSMDRGGVQKISLPYNKLIVAARLGMQPETLSRAMRRLKDDLNMSFEGREATIPNLDDLQDYCEVYCCRDQECSLKEKLLCNAPYCDVSRMLRMM